MILSRYTLKNINKEVVTVPDESMFGLEEKVLQFGTGALLRGLCDYIIDTANRKGIFNGRIVVVKSTSQGDLSAFDTQDYLYTSCVRGLHNGKKLEENIINSSISRVLNAAEQWEQVLECAHNAQLQVIISNTTEMGIQLVNDDVRHYPPKSFPGKVLAFLYERYKAFGGSEHSGMVIVPTELIPDNGNKLESIVLELAHLNGLEVGFIEWIEKYNFFCNSLVDRIVPGRPVPEIQSQIEAHLGYQDQLLNISEVYCLWAIEGHDKVRNILSFAQANDCVIIKPDIEIYRELKLRLLNGTHTLSCGLAFFADCQTVNQAMNDESISSFITTLMYDEIAPCIPYDVSLDDAYHFGRNVLDRFRNPHIRHLWTNILFQYSSKMKLRCVPVLLKHYQTHATPPAFIALGFAAYLRFMQPVIKKEEQYFGVYRGKHYLIQDDRAAFFYNRIDLSANSLVEEVLSDISFWGEDLSRLPGFGAAVTAQFNLINSSDVKKAIEVVNAKKAMSF